jgi:adenylate cyclase
LEELEAVPFRDAPQRLDVLRRLPELIRTAVNERQGLSRLVDLLLAGIPLAEGVAVVDRERVLHWDRRHSAGGPLVPSRRLIREALSEQRCSVSQWGRIGRNSASAAAYTVQDTFDWAFCTPVRIDADICWGLYVAGHIDATTPHTVFERGLQEDVKFAELVGDIYGSVRQVQQLQQRQGLFRRFFSPAVLALLAGRDAAEALAPREADVTVVFCDLRGFSRAVEAAAGDLLTALQRVSAALGIMTQAILRHGGVVADFLGDAALGFWGWPTSQPGRIRDAALAALDIRTQFAALAADPQHILQGFRVGIGIASGRAVAGGIGTAEQLKVTVFGPSVNLAARLQDLTKLLSVPILLDEATAEALRRLEQVPFRVRRLAQLIPAGLTRPIMVSELLPAAPAGALDDADLLTYEQALDAFLAGRWDDAYRLLHRIPPEDRGKDLLMTTILQHGRKPPSDWNGVIALPAKS